VAAIGSYSLCRLRFRNHRPGRCCSSASRAITSDTNSQAQRSSKGRRAAPQKSPAPKDTIERGARAGGRISASARDNQTRQIVSVKRRQPLDQG
jgi:hypothetical protein